MNYSEIPKKKLKAMKKSAQKKLIISFIALILGIVFIVFEMNDIIPVGVGTVVFILCTILSLINTFYIGFAIIMPIDKELSRRAAGRMSKAIKTIIPSNCNTTVTMISSNIRDINEFGYGLKKKTTYYIWKKEDTLCFLPTIINDVKNAETYLRCMPISDILCYEIIGERYHENRISGGGGRKISLTGALLGNAIGGTAGAVLLGNKGSKAIQSTDIVHDTRAVCFRFSNQREIHFSFSDYSTFNIVIPEKNAEQILTSGISQNRASTTSAEVEKIKEYKKLLDDGIITQDEFDTKKKQIMGI